MSTWVRASVTPECEVCKARYQAHNHSGHKLLTWLSPVGCRETRSQKQRGFPGQYHWSKWGYIKKATGACTPLFSTTTGQRLDLLFVPSGPACPIIVEGLEWLCMSVFPPVILEFVSVCSSCFTVVCCTGMPLLTCLCFHCIKWANSLQTKGHPTFTGEHINVCDA